MSAPKSSDLPKGHYPLSLSQEYVWSGLRVSGEARGTVVVIGLQGSLQIDSLRQALDDVVERHDALRTAFQLEEVNPRAVVESGWKGLRVFPAARPELAARVWAAQRHCPPSGNLMHVTREGSIRAELFTADPSSNVLVLTLSPMCFDEHSIRVLTRDLSLAYSARCHDRNPRWAPLPIQYGAYSERQRMMLCCEADQNSRLARHLRFWKPRLEEYATARRQKASRGSKSFASLPIRINSKLHSSALDFSKRKRVNPLVIAHTALLFAVAEQQTRADVVVRVSGSRRGALNRLIGLFEESILLSTRLDDGLGFDDLLLRVREAHQSAGRHRGFPIRMLLERFAAADQGDGSFHFGISLGRAGKSPLAFPDVNASVHVMRPPVETCEVFLDLMERRTPFGEAEGVEGWVQYRSDLFTQEQIRSFLERWYKATSDAVGDSEQPHHPRRRVHSRADASSTDRRSPASEHPCRPYVGPYDSLQQRLTRIWEEELFGIHRISVKDEFFELGGSAELGQRLRAEILRSCGVSLPDSILQPELTIESLSAALLERVPSRPVLELTPARDHGQSPLIFLHGDFSGGGFYAHGLAERLGPHQPFYVLQQHGLNGYAVPPSIPQMAEDQLRELKQQLPHGPYLVAGYCSGGLIAFEMARRLWSEGEEIKLLALIDPPPLGGPQVVSAPLQTGASSGDARARGIKLFHQYLGPVSRYQPSPYPGKVMLLSSGHDVSKRVELQRLWATVAKKVICHRVRGTHLTCIGSELGDLADRLKSCVETAQ